MGGQLHTDTQADNTNRAELELYGMLGEADGAGFLLAYCLLSTASSIEDSKCQLALKSFLEKVQDMYQLNPTFMHTDKDISEVNMCHDVWPDAKHVLCSWHMQRSWSEHLAKVKLLMTLYDPLDAHTEFDFVHVD